MGMEIAEVFKDALLFDVIELSAGSNWSKPGEMVIARMPAIVNAFRFYIKACTLDNFEVWDKEVTSLLLTFAILRILFFNINRDGKRE